MRAVPRLVCIAVLLILAGCSAMEPKDFAGTTPDFAVERYFLGHVKGYGLIENRSGDVQRQFTVDMVGSWTGDEFGIKEDFVYDDGSTQHREWRIHKLDDHRYEAHADDVVGVNEGQSYGRAANWRYTLLVPYKGRDWALSMDDWMFLQPDDVLINHVRMSKWGIGVGNVLITFRRLG